MPELIVALDFSEAAPALALAHQLRPQVQWLKVGLELFTAAGPELLARLKELHYKVFLDLKFYDIPNTVARATRAAAPLADLLTVHLQGGERMCQAALEAADACQNPPIIAGVTALTSFAAGEMPGINTEPGIFARELARLAAQWQLGALVCSAREARTVGEAAPGLLRICPGIRPAGCAQGDQRRVATPGEAAHAGADFLVIGRPIAQARDPLEAARAILAEIAAA